jgi:hypothetical protein
MRGFHRKKLAGLVGVLVICLLLPLSYSVYSSGLSPPPLKGTFLQIYRHHDSWHAEKWTQLFNYLRILQIREVVVQWTVYDDATFLPGQNRGEPSQTLNRIMSLAAAAGIKVWLGLVYDPHFWEKINREPALVEVYLRRLSLQSEATARLLAQAYPNIAGWYIATEIDDKHWQANDSRQVLFDYLKDLTAYLHWLQPGSKVAISGFSNALMDPNTLEHFWNCLLKASDIDMVFFQDGIGAQKLKLSALPLYLNAIQRAVQRQGRRLGVVVELFRQIRAEPFQAGPTTWESLQQQIAIAERYAPNNLLAFSIPDYLSPLGGEAAARLYQQYLDAYLRPSGVTPANCPPSRIK